MYLIHDGARIYTGFRDGRPFTLVDAMRAVHGQGQCTILRADGTVVVRNAGSWCVVEYAPTGVRLARGRPARTAREVAEDARLDALTGTPNLTGRSARIGSSRT